ncbi:hypothetical protein AGMMS50239_26620 [Bacteroidia bacterium]|nr:hypothetical protein AGMMS50239_26620 [Bacteroidia bacterium]
MKQYNFKRIRTTLSICSLLLLASCIGDFENFNTHPTNPAPDDMTAPERVGTLFPSLLYLMHNYQENDNQMIEQMIGNQYGGYMATTNNWQGTNYGTFNPSAGWMEYPFNKLFSGFYANYFKIKDITGGKGYIYAWANIVRVGVMLRVTDTYGPVPYSKMGEGQLAVVYDDMQTVYHNMIQDLDNSIASLTAFLGENQGKANPMAEFDLIYRGNFSKWIKFANSLKLRMAIRIAAVDTDYAKEVMVQAIAGGTIESNVDNAFLPTTDNPYYKAAIDWGDLAINAVLSTYMNGYADPRCPVYMTKTGVGTYIGVRMGINNINKQIYSMSALFSKPNFTTGSPLLVFCAAETQFLKAEAALQGWIAGGEAQAGAYYLKGINTSMEQHEVTAGAYTTTVTYPGAYSDPISGITVGISNISVPWNDVDAAANTRLAKIITQKWLANYPLGFESWCDFRRTGYPQIFSAQDNLSTDGSMGTIDNSIFSATTYNSRLVRRLPYPVSEYNGNPVNVANAVSTMLGGPDKGSTNLWWAKKQ